MVGALGSTEWGAASGLGNAVMGGGMEGQGGSGKDGEYGSGWQIAVDCGSGAGLETDEGMG